MNAVLQQFAEAIAQPEESLQLDRAALLLGGIAGDGALDLPRCLARLDELAELSQRAAQKLDTAPWAAARATSLTLFGELGFRGNVEQYYDPRNSFLHQVLERRVGIPISLSVLYIEVLRRQGVVARGVGFPGHFLARVESAEGTLIVDSFHRGDEPDEAGLAALLERRNGPGFRVEKAMLEPIGKRAILTRMLFNLSGIYGQRNDWLRSLAVLERLALLDPENPRIHHELRELRARARSVN